MNKLISFFSGNKKRLLIAVLAIVGILTVLLSSGGEKDDVSMDLSQYKKELESELEDMLSDAEGVGKCRVTVTFAEGESSEYKGSKVTSTSPPRVLGVTVVCEGGGSHEVSSEITDSLCSLFDIGANRVCVMKMKK